MKQVVIFLLLILTTQSTWAKKLIFNHMGRNFTLVTPDSRSSSPKPLVVLLHGCKQDADLILAGTRFTEMGQRNDFIILAPEQSLLNNTDHCWNWFMPPNQDRLPLNEMAQVMSALEIVMKSNRVNREKIFVAGMSSGGAMAHNLMVCYPDVFKAGAIHSGLAYRTAETLIEAQKVLTAQKQKSPSYLGKRAYACAPNSKKKLEGTLVIHGDKDPRVKSLHADLIGLVNHVWMDYLDDGRKNNSVAFTDEAYVQRFENGYAGHISTRHYRDGFTHKLIYIRGLAHAWGGGKPISPNFDPKAPSSTDLILEFFKLNR